MRALIGLLFLVSCAELPRKVESPSWVSAVRSGEETLKVVNGSKTYFRRVAGSSKFSKELSCQLAITRAEEDIRKEFPNFSQVPFTVEVIYYDSEKQDCATTVSVATSFYQKHSDVVYTQGHAENRTREIASLETVSEDEATEYLRLKGEIASKFALTGMTKLDFEKFSKEKVALNNDSGICHTYFKTNTYSIHGPTHVCWKGENVVGYCTLKDSQCWTKTP